jgi:heavy metal sensor kinase
MTLRWRVGLWSLAVLVGTQLALMAIGYLVVRHTLWRSAQERAAARAAEICGVLAQEDREQILEVRRGQISDQKRTAGPMRDGSDELLLSPGALAAFAFDGALIRIRDGSGARVGVSALVVASQASTVALTGLADPTEDVRDVMIAREHVRLSQSRYRQPLSVAVAFSLGPAQHTLARVGLVLSGIGLLTLLLAVPATFALVGRTLSPIERISRQAEAYSAGDLSLRLPGEESADEVGRMVVAFNRLLGRLEAAFQRESRFTSDAAHELRTPLTILRGEVELALREQPDSTASIRATLHSLKEEIERLEGLVGNLLTLARSETAQAALDAEPVSLLELSSEVIGRLAYLARSQDVRLEVSPDSTDQTVLGDPATLRQALFNVVQNALRHSPRGSSVRLRIFEDSGHATVEVCDTGPGIPEAAIPHLFDRFFRADPARSRLSERGQGLGLGLAITRAVVQAHGGEVCAENRPLRGAKFTITLPASGG